MNKSDLTNLPFEKIRERTEAKTNELSYVLKQDMQKAVNAVTSRKVADLARELSNSLESTEGLEESIRETINIPEFDLSSEQLNKIERDARSFVVSSFVHYYSLGSKHTWFLPHMIARFGTWKPVRNLETNKYDCKMTLDVNTLENDFNYGLWAVSMHPRSELIKTTADAPLYKLKEYNYLVPLVLAGFKKYQNINYNEWDRDTIPWLVDADLGKAMLTELPEMSLEDILDLRSIAHTPKTGNRAGKTGNPITTASLYHLGDYTKHDFTKTPKLALHMMMQTWLAHPANRSPNVQILDPRDWDNVPEPLINSNIIGKPTYDWGTSTKAGVYDKPW